MVKYVDIGGLVGGVGFNKAREAVVVAVEIDVLEYIGDKDKLFHGIFQYKNK